jgi:uncharacterized membrane protein
MICNLRPLFLGSLAVLVLASCGGGGSSNPLSSGATCPSGSTLTYENFGKKFMTDYCVRCHSSTLVGATARPDAPAGINFDTLGGVVNNRVTIDAQAASGPSATHTAMPPDGAMPTADERTKLGEWLACGVP